MEQSHYRHEAAWSHAGSPPDREYLEQTLLPLLAKEGKYMLFVGVADYTAHYHDIVGRDVRFVTTDASCDIDEHGKAEFPFNVGDPEFPFQLSQALISSGEKIPYFDTIVLNGIFGWGTNTEAEIAQSLSNARLLLRAGGKVLLGWNSPEYPTKIHLPDEKLLAMARSADFHVRRIEGDEIFTGPRGKKWSPDMHGDYQYHRYTLLEKPLIPLSGIRKRRQ